MSIPEYVLAGTLVGLLVLVGLLGMLIIGYSAFERRREQRTDTIQTRLQSALLERLFSSDPGWASWVDELDREERRVLKSLLDKYLRRIKGTDFDHLRDLAKELGIPHSVRSAIEDGSRTEHALTWLALLHEPVEADWLVEVCGNDPVLREIGAKILLNSDHPDGPERGTELLLKDETRPMTVMGMDTLYRLNNGSSTPLLSHLENRVRHWNESWLVQVLSILSHCSVTGSLARLDWLVDLLDHHSPRVRLAVLSVIRRHGWREAIRSRLEFDQLLDDPDSKLRKNTYLLLADWGDEESLNWLLRATETEQPQDRLSVVEAINLHPDGSLADLPDEFDRFVEWVPAESNVRSARRMWDNASGWL